MKPMADMVETMQRQRYLLGNLCHGETGWLPQFREPSAGEVIEVWDCGQDTIPSEDRCYRLVTGARAVILSPGVIHPPGLVIDRPSFVTDIDPLRPHIVTRPEFPTATFTS